MSEPEILLAEDEQVHARLIVETLAAAGIANRVCTVATNDGIRARLADQAAPPVVLVLLDLHLAGGSGLDVLRSVSAGEGDTPPVIVLTSSDDSTDIESAFSLGATAYLIKPVGFDALVDVLRGLDLRWLLLSKHADP